MLSIIQTISLIGLNGKFSRSSDRYNWWATKF